eukprot:5861409-Prymnesium_polylepis.1
MLLELARAMRRLHTSHRLSCHPRNPLDPRREDVRARSKRALNCLPRSGEQPAITFRQMQA